ncbi:type II secretion system minor pseudopilin GspH [Methylonatrum kenyense]|uniref:type II secretion system minor pseudopilin GspH n=1 Tax=Methylonatrum kenyense TaxID=455253 RepID=UPI0020C0687D|nr:type II secretion system minor pseudopilin GspH [Methylonatrum kenyense]MCK8517030.1 type II secretion system minor pseudopilin GspH [Methylonatrum kenyense]
MRRSATSTLIERRCRGFTLIELLVVLVLIAIITSLAVTRLSLGGDPRLEREAQRLVAVLDMAMETAIIQSREFGLVLEEDGYAFVRLEAGEWQPYGGEGDRIFRPHRLPDDVRLDWEREERQPRGERRGGDNGRQSNAPTLLLLSSGESSPAELELHWQDSRAGEGSWRVQLNSLGRLRLLGPNGDGPP